MNDMAKCSLRKQFGFRPCYKGSQHQRRPSDEVKAPEIEEGALFEGLGDGCNEEFKRSVYPSNVLLFSKTLGSGEWKYWQLFALV